jgi:hypothetical protein
MLRALAVLWALPTTLVGALLLAIAVLTGGRAARAGSVIEAHGGWLRRALRRLPIARGGGVAVTLGHVVLGTDAETLRITRAHERVHVAQCERWGPFFLPAYALASLWALLSGRDPYRDNRFERQAFAANEPGAGGGPGTAVTPVATPSLATPPIATQGGEPPVRRTARIRAARIIAAAADLLQIVLFPAFAAGWISPLNDALDVLVAVLMVRLVGWHLGFLPTFVAEIVPGVDLIPTWTAAVWLATRGGGPARQA